jgi:hypothetical protein
MSIVSAAGMTTISLSMFRLEESILRCGLCAASARKSKNNPGL